MAILEKRELTRVNMNLPTEIVNSVKVFANGLGLPITQAYTVLLNQALEQKSLYDSLPDMIKAFNRIIEIKDLNKITDNIIESDSEI